MRTAVLAHIAVAALSMLKLVAVVAIGKYDLGALLAPCGIAVGALTSARYIATGSTSSRRIGRFGAVIGAVGCLGGLAVVASMARAPLRDMLLKPQTALGFVYLSLMCSSLVRQ